jgi:hypothetical protein
VPEPIVKRLTIRHSTTVAGLTRSRADNRFHNNVIVGRGESKAGKDAHHAAAWAYGFMTLASIRCNWRQCLLQRSATYAKEKGHVSEPAIDPKRNYRRRPQFQARLAVGPELKQACTTRHHRCSAKPRFQDSPTRTRTVQPSRSIRIISEETERSQSNGRSFEDPPRSDDAG